MVGVSLLAQPVAAMGTAAGEGAAVPAWAVQAGLGRVGWGLRVVEGAVRAGAAAAPPQVAGAAAAAAAGGRGAMEGQAAVEGEKEVPLAAGEAALAAAAAGRQSCRRSTAARVALHYGTRDEGLNLAAAGFDALGLAQSDLLVKAWDAAHMCPTTDKCA